MIENLERNRYEGIDPIIAYHLRNIVLSLSALATDTNALKIKGVGIVLTQAETAVHTATDLIREQKG